MLGRRGGSRGPDLVISATGATAAFVVTSANIKNGTFQPRSQPGAKPALRGKRGFTGAPGPQGVQGVQGAQGVIGPSGGFDPAKVTCVEGAVVTIAPDSFSEANATCPTGVEGHLRRLACGTAPRR
jgi:hypothetical protein